MHFTHFGAILGVSFKASVEELRQLLERIAVIVVVVIVTAGGVVVIVRKLEVCAAEAQTVQNCSSNLFHVSNGFIGT